MLKKLSLYTIFIVVMFVNTSAISANHTQLSLINDVSFHNSDFDKPNAGNGFMVTVDGHNYAITAKHILMIVKTDKMQVVDFAGELKQWKMVDKSNPSNHIVVKDLLNTNKQEKLEWETLKDDWIVFSIKENNSENSILTFRQEPLKKGEKLSVIGWAYQDKEGPQRVYQYEYIDTDTDTSLLTIEQIKGPESLAGLSGSAVVDENNQVVGVVSTGWQDEKTKKTFIQASQGKDIEAFIKRHQRSNND